MILIICVIINDIEKINIIKNTWNKFCDELIKIFFIINNNEIPINNDYIYINNSESDIHFSILRHFNNTEYNFIMITYDNSFIYIPNLLKLINTLDYDDEYYIGGHGDYRLINNIKFYFHSYLPGIILSKLASNLLIDDNLMKNYNNECLNNDLKNLSGIAIAYYVKLFNIKIIMNDNFYYCNWKGNPCHVYNVDINNLICCSNMEIKDFLNFYNTLIDDQEENNLEQNNLEQNNLEENNLEQNNQKENNMHLIICVDGGLGNLIFQYLNGYVLQKKYNCKLSFQTNYNYWRGDIANFKIFEHLNFVDLNKFDASKYQDYNEKKHYYYDINLKQKNYKISGYYQSFKYSEKYINEIKNELYYNVASTYYKMEALYYKIKNNKTTCLIHVRRGDYLYFSNVHPSCTDHYYLKAINLIPNCKYLVFSDDIPYVSNWSVLKNKDFEIININDPEEILILMSLCDNFIIANSTLSLLAYLFRNNKNAKLIAPKKWFGNCSYEYKIEDIVPNEATLI